MKQIALIAMLVLATGCYKDPERTEIKGVGGFQVATLFTHDGCTVYRFSDGGRGRYFVKCENGNAMTMTEHTQGKSSFPETIQTESVE